MKTIKIDGCKFKQQEIEIISSHIKKINERIKNELKDEKDGAKVLYKMIKIQKEEEDRLTEHEKQVINNYAECIENNKKNPAKRYFFTVAITLFILISGSNPAVPAIILLAELAVVLVLCLLNVRSSINFNKTIKLAKMVNEHV